MTTDPAARESLPVELVDAGGVAIGVDTVAAAHRAPGRLHRAFSVVLVDPAGRMLLQRRSAAKTRFPLRWANACCGHPMPGQPPTDAAGPRLREELGLAGVRLTEVGVYVYRAEDVLSGHVEHEYDHVLVGHVTAGLRPEPDPAEVADLRWVPAAEVEQAVAEDPATYAPWLAGVAAVAAGHLATAGGGRAERPGAR